MVCATISSVRLFMRSAATPANGATISSGSALTPAMMPSAEAWSVRSKAKKPRRINCICMAMKKATFPPKYQR